MTSRQWVESSWRGFVWAPNRLPVFPSEECEAHSYGGLYFMWSLFPADQGALIYVGRSVEIGRRLYRHGGSRSITRGFLFSTIRMDSAGGLARYLDSFEAAYTNGLRPPNNCKFDKGHWEGGPRMRRLVARVWRPFLCSDGLYRRDPAAFIPDLTERT